VSSRLSFSLVRIKSGFRYTKALENIKSLRKDRVAELKTDKERLTSLELEKGHSDRLNARMKRLTSDIEKKETEYGILKEELEQLVEQNRKLAETSSRFREVFLESRNLVGRKESLESDLRDGLENLVELTRTLPSLFTIGTNLLLPVVTDDELADRKQNFERYCQQTQLRRERKQKDLVREQESQTQDHSELLQLIERKAKLQADQNVSFHTFRTILLLSFRKVFEKNVESRIELVRTVSIELDIRGFDIPNLSESQIDDFRDKLREVRKRRKTTLEEVQVSKPQLAFIIGSQINLIEGRRFKTRSAEF
jgi:DNA repair protein RAD50